MDLVEDIYRVSTQFPKPELYGLTSQIRSAAISVPSNIAEGHDRKGTKEFLHHLSIARGSLAELETQLILAVRLKYASKTEAEKIWKRSQSVGKLLNGLIRSLRE